MTSRALTSTIWFLSGAASVLVLLRSVEVPATMTVAEDSTVSLAPASCEHPASPAARTGREVGTRDTSLLEAIIQIESHGDPSAVGDGGLAVGLLQIHPIMVEDCNRILGHQEFTLSDRLDPDRSREMFWVYTDHYSNKASREVVARRWNGGPDGDRQRATISYWRKIKDLLDAERSRSSTG